MIAAYNPCPCGLLGGGRQCDCSINSIQRYQKKISGPIIDRIDLSIDVSPVPTDKILMSQNVKSGSLKVSDFRKLVIKARRKQIERSGVLNSQLANSQINEVASMSNKVKKMFDEASAKLDLSARAYVRTLRVARTIADIEGSPNVQADHVAEALQYRQKSASG
jgi:magnesium chelatase family protein